MTRTRFTGTSTSVTSLGLGDRVINQGPTNQAYIINALINWLGDPSAPSAPSRSASRGNVYAGDRVEAGGEVTAIYGRSMATKRSPTATCGSTARDGRVIAGTAVVRA